MKRRRFATLILAVACCAPIAARGDEAIPYQCGFEEAVDVDFDLWPDQWTRRRERGFPHYLKIAVSEEECPEGSRALRMELDGGAAEVYSPPIAVDPRISYMAEVWVRTEGLVHDEAHLSLVFLDAEQRPLDSFRSPGAGGSEPWQKLRIGPVTSRHDKARFAVLGLHLGPTDGRDLFGAAVFDSVRLLRLPNVDFSTGDPANVVSAGQPVTIAVDVAGLDEAVDSLGFQLIDADGRVLATKSKDSPDVAPLEVPTDAPGWERGHDLVAESSSWSPPIEAPGFYRVRVHLPGYDGPLDGQEATLAVVDSAPTPSQGEFGWTLPRGDVPLDLATLAELLPRAGIRWVKFPLWIDPDDAGRAEALTHFIDALRLQGVTTVGLLAAPDPEPRPDGSYAPADTAAVLFGAEPEKWYPTLEPTLARFALKVRSWQLGRDDDGSFAGYPAAPVKVRTVKTELDRIGQDLQIGVGWDWLDEQLPAVQVPWRFASRATHPPLTADEMGAYLEANRHNGVAQWVSLRPLSSRDFDTTERAVDLVRRMIAAKVHGATAVFIDDPFDPDTGLMQPNGTAGELFLPWRTAALTLSGAKYAGEINLPGDSENRVFFHDGEALLAVWNDQPTQEALYLGPDVEVVDVWGRRSRPPRDGGRSILEVGRLPISVVGLSPEVTRTRMNFALSPAKIPSVFTAPHPATFRFRNEFDGTMTGMVRIVVPADWRAQPSEVPLKLAPGEETEIAFELLAPYTAELGAHPLQFDFQATAADDYRFSVFESLDVGLGQMKLAAVTERTANGELEVRQTLENLTDEPVSFRCHLFAPGRRRLRSQVMDLEQGEAERTYVLPDADALLGRKIWIRAEEIGGPRVLNLRLIAEP